MTPADSFAKPQVLVLFPEEWPMCPPSFFSTSLSMLTSP
jgi:hypothetical protein